MSKEVAVKKENDTEKNESINSIIDKLSPIERKVVSHLNLSFKKIVEKSGLEESGVIMALKSLEEQFLDVLPLEKGKLESEQAYAFEQLKDRKDIVELKEEKLIRVQLTELGKQIAGKEITTDLLEEVTPEIIASGKGKKFRHYDVTTSVPEIYGGKKHFVNQSIEYAKKIWTDLGFKEMTGTIADTSFWNFDALFTAQDHPVREIHDTFFLKDINGKLSDKKIVENVKKAHESGVSGSKGWQYSWKEGEALKPLLRTHTTPLSAHTLARLKDKDIPGKFFAVGRCFRNETVDWSHGFEFNQTEGIVVDEKENFRHSLGYLKE